MYQKEEKRQQDDVNQLLLHFSTLVKFEQESL
jgi:hypothetical protein